MSTSTGDNSLKASGRKFGSAILWIIVQAKSWWGTFFVCLIFTLVMIYHCVIPLGALPFNDGIKGQDCGQMAWDLWVVNESITSGRNPYSTDRIFYPLGSRLSYHTLAAGFFPVTFLIKQLLGGNQLYPIFAYRIIILISFTLTLFSSDLLLRQLGFQGWPAIIPPIAYAFCGFYMFHVFHLNYIAGFFIPMTALFLVKLLQKPAAVNALVVVSISSLAIYFTDLALYIYFGTAVFVLLILTTSQSRRDLKRILRTLGFKSLLACVSLGILILAPFLVNLAATNVLKPLAVESSYYSANLAGFFVPVGSESPLYDGMFQSLSSRITEGMGEGGVFIGFPMLFLSLLGLIWSRKKEVYIYSCGLMSLVSFVLSLGPTLKVFNRDTGLIMPYALLMNVPPFNNGRAPVRFVVMAMFFMMILSAAGLSRLSESLRAFWGRRLSTLGMSLLLVWIVAEAYSPCPTQKRFVPPAALKNIVNGPVLNLPLNRNDGYASLLQIFHRQPIATGYIARYSVDQWNRFSELERLFSKGGADFCNGIVAMGFRNIIIAPDNIVRAAPSVAPLDLARCRINVVDLRSDTGRLVETERPESFPDYIAGQRLDLTSHEAEKFLWYGWSGPEPAFRWTDREDAAIVFALEHERRLLMRIQLAPFLNPGKLSVQHVEIYLNGHPISDLNLTDPEPRQYTIAIDADAVKTRNILHFHLPGAESPQSMGVSGDQRLLGISVNWLELDEDSR